MQNSFIFTSINRFEVLLEDNFFDLDNNNIVTFKNDYLKGKNNCPGFNADLFITLHGIKYVIPEEALVNNTISTIEIENWKI